MVKSLNIGRFYLLLLFLLLLLLLLLLLNDERCDKYSGLKKKCMSKIADGVTGCNEDSDCSSGKCWNKLTKFSTCGYIRNSGKRLENYKRCNGDGDCKTGR